MPYQKDKTGKVKLRKNGNFWHLVKHNGTLSSIKGSTQQKARNALHAYEVIAHGAKKHKA